MRRGGWWIGVSLLVALSTGCARMNGAPATDAEPMPDLAGTRWSVLALDEGAEAVAAGPIVATLEFDPAAGRVSGSAGCNRYSASASVDGSKVVFGPAAASKRMCADPTGVMAFEVRFLAALSRVVQARATGDRLELRAADGSVVATLLRVPA